MVKKSFCVIIGVLFICTGLVLAQARHIMVPGSAFVGFDNSQGYWIYEYLRKQTGSGSTVAPVYFPDSATGLRVRRIDCLVRDNTATGYVRIYLYKVDLFTGTTYTACDTQTTIGFASGGANTFINDTTSSPINNFRWIWFTAVHISEPGKANLRFYGMRIKYW